MMNGEAEALEQHGRNARLVESPEHRRQSRDAAAVGHEGVLEDAAVTSEVRLLDTEALQVVDEQRKQALGPGIQPVEIHGRGPVAPGRLRRLAVEERGAQQLQLGRRRPVSPPARGRGTGSRAWHGHARSSAPALPCVKPTGCATRGREAGGDG